MKRRILIVDDDVACARLLQLSLEQTNHYEVRVENWPEDAHAAALSFQPDLVLLDVMMPRMVGGDVAARFQADARLEPIPLVFFTAALGKSRVAQHDGIIGRFPFLAKPADLRAVIDCIERQLAGRVPASATAFVGQAA